MIDVVVLAAGAGRRLGTVAKATLEVDGETYLARIARTAAESGASKPVVVVAEPHRAETVAEAERLGLDCVENPDPDRGMGSSVAVGFEYLSSRGSKSAAALMWPVDHPVVSPKTVHELSARVSPDRAVIPTYQGRGGHPVLVGASLWPEMSRAAELPEGARSVFRADPARVLRVAVDDPGVVRDVDTPEAVL